MEGTDGAVKATEGTATAGTKGADPPTADAATADAATPSALAPDRQATERQASNGPAPETQTPDTGTSQTADDALYVLTAVLLTPAEFPGVLGDDYPAACATLGLEPYADGYGLVLGQDGHGARWTVATDDVTLVACAIAAWDCGMAYDLSPVDDSIAAALPGWPLEVAVAAPGVPAPHDPEPDPELDGDQAPLTPPDTEVWGPAQRRLGADEIALRWADWRAQVDDETTFAEPGATPDPEVRQVLDEARAYLAAPPPPGRVRSSFAASGARTLRVDGPGWSLVARTDDIAFVLRDDDPGQVLPVGRGPELPQLLTALEGLAARPGTY